MCGIAGIYNYRDPSRPIDRALLERMTRALAHRGPDGEGFFVDGPVGLGHRRLAIVDLSPTGAQPMTTSDGSATLVYNGELYNHRELRPSLEARGHVFRGPSDTETMLYWLRAFGPAALERCAGIFGLALWDARDKRLLLARDPLGVKQLYTHDDGQRLLFASEIKALLECDEVPRALDQEGLNEYLHFHAPLFERTLFAGIGQVPAAQVVLVDRHGPRAKQYWSLEGCEPLGASAEEHVALLRERLEQVVASQLMSDVPVATFFSGGIDSSAVTAFAMRAGVKPRAFGVHFAGGAVIDERPFQEAAARALGVELALTTLDGATLPQDLERLMHAQDQPVIGAALLPMDAVSRLAAREVKVCLGGQAADELFGGYARYALAHPLRTAASWYRGRHVVVDSRAAGEDAPESAVGGSLWKQLADRKNLGRLVRVARHAHDWRRMYFDNFAKVSEHAWRALMPGASALSRDHAFDAFVAGTAATPSDDPGIKLLHWDMRTYLTGLFQQDDRMSMQHGLESRVPLADPRLVRHAFHVPFDLKLRSGTTKWVLRRAVADVLPASVLNRRKVGFDTPIEAWLRGRHREFTREVLLGQRSRERGLFDARAIERVLGATHDPYWLDKVWKLLSIELWAQLFLDRRAPGSARPAPAGHSTVRPEPETGAPPRRAAGEVPV